MRKQVPTAGKKGEKNTDFDWYLNAVIYLFSKQAKKLQCKSCEAAKYGALLAI